MILWAIRQTDYLISHSAGTIPAITACTLFALRSSFGCFLVVFFNRVVARVVYYSRVTFALRPFAVSYVHTFYKKIGLKTISVH